ncbi:MAG: hypothetical protein IIT41_05260 [Oscillospiraceae bacterium]|nr:hypothetical protein [Oscillospiraceae bacterium]
MRQQEAHRALLAGVEAYAGVDGPVLLRDGRGVVAGVALGHAGGDVHRETRLPRLRKVLDVDREPLRGREVERAATVTRLDAQAARPFGARHPKPHRRSALAHHLRTMNRNEPPRIPREVGAIAYCHPVGDGLRPGGRIQTSTATVAVLPEAEEVDFHLDLDEVQIDTFRSSGAGGQKVNKTSSAIRVTHVPTGTVVECQDERSQYRNKDKALDILRSKLYEAELEKRRSAVAGERKSQVGTGERSEKIRTYFYQRDSVVDRRLSGDDKSFPLRKVLDGGLDELIDALITADRAEKLRSGNED